MRPSAVLPAAVLLACESLPAIDEGACGNRVLDVQEDCDTFVDPALGQGLACGARDTDAACRYVCGHDSACPTGWGCGEKGICQRASESFEPGGSIPGWSPESLEPVDFNGDGVVDLAGAFEQRLEFREGGESGTFEALAPIPTDGATGRLAVAGVNGDELDDVILPTRLGFLVWRGEAEGPPLQAAFAALKIDRAKVVPVRAASAGPAGFIVPLFERDGLIWATVHNYALWHQDGEIPIGAGDLSQLGDRVPAVDLDADERDEIVTGFRGTERVAVYGIRHDILAGSYDLAGFGSSPDGPMIVYVGACRACERCSEQVEGCAIDRGVRAADVDGDGWQDVIVGLACGPEQAPRVAVAPGRGADGFEPAYLDDRFGDVGFPLAAADFNGDGAADYVTAHGIYIGDPAHHTVELTQTPEPGVPWGWTDATLADVDGDGTLDLIAFAHGEPFIDVLLCGTGPWSCLETGRFDRHLPPYQTERGVKKLRVGSLQTGSAKDIVFVEGDDDGQGDALGVLYANPLDRPSEAVRHAQFHRIDELEVAPAPVVGQHEVDLFEDVQIVARSEDGATVYAHLYADGARHLNSPLFLPDGTGLLNNLASGRQALAGRFFEDELDSDDLVLLGQRTDSVPRAWLVRRKADAAFPPPKGGQVLLDELGESFSFECARIKSGDIDGDGRDEVLAVYGSTICPEQPTTWLAIGRERDGALAFERSELSLTPGGGANLALTDLNDDGASDIVLAETGRALVYFGNPTGELLEPEMLELPFGEPVLDMAPLARGADGNARSGAALLTSASGVLISWDGHALEKHGFTSSGARAVRSADIDRDGLADLLLVGDGGIEVLRSVPDKPLGEGQ